jgi:tetratricopeptide (TPR) repeat protein
MSSVQFSSEGFDLDSLPAEGSENVVLELGGGSTMLENKNQDETAANTDDNDKVPSPIDKSEEYKARGNDNFKKGAYLEAYDMYTEAIEACPGMTGVDLLQLKEDFDEQQHEELVKRHRQMDEERRKRRERGESGDPTAPEPLPEFVPPPHEYGEKHLAVYHCNRAACCLYLQRYEDAIQDCTVATLLQPKYTKAWARRSQAYEKTELTEEALKDAQKALECDPTNVKLRQNVHRLQKIEEERLEKLKEETLGKLKELGNSILGNFGMSIDNFQAVQDPNTGSYSISYNSNKGASV